MRHASETIKWQQRHKGNTALQMRISPNIKKGIANAAVILIMSAFFGCAQNTISPAGNNEALSAADTSKHAAVMTGLDVLERDGFRQLAGKRIGLITNHSSVNRKGENAAEAMSKAGNIKLKKIFSPEHGFKGTENEGMRIENSTDAATGLQIISLYGKNRLRPSQEMLQGIDVLVFDIQDIGARFYTYLTTMGYAMEEAAKAGLTFAVLDRPNPIGGITEGPILEDGISKFTAYFKVPARHGLTAGEMALFHKNSAQPGTPLASLNLKIIKAEGWNRNMFFKETGIKWTNPSPNIRETDAETLYPGIGCFEASNLSVGRGTEIPFLWFGAPWLDGKKLATQLNEIKLPGLSFSPLAQKPDRSVHEGKECGGVRINVKDQKAVRALDLLVWISYYLKKNHPNDFKFRENEIRDMTGSSDLFNMLEAGKSPADIIKIYRKASDEFEKRTQNIRLYE